MADIGDSIKKIWNKGVEAIGSTANNIAASTRFKIDEKNMGNQRRDILNSVGPKAYELWQSGTALPPELDELMREVAAIDAKLAESRETRIAPKEPDGAEDADGPQEKDTSLETGKKPTMADVPSLNMDAVLSDDDVPTLQPEGAEKPEEAIERLAGVLKEKTAETPGAPKAEDAPRAPKLTIPGADD